MKRALAFAALLVATPAAAQNLAPDQIQPGTYTIDSKETLVRYGVIHMGFSEFWGTFPDAAGTLTIDPKNVSGAKLDVTVPVVGLETTNRELNGELFSDTFFFAEKFPKMHFVSTSVTRTGPTTAKVTGDLTIHGITKPVTLDVTFGGAGPNAFNKVPTLGFSAHGQVNRSDFGLGKYVPIVSDATTITISAAFELKPA
jgi:polyisoprenoid-binding protein YceI